MAGMLKTGAVLVAAVALLGGCASQTKRQAVGGDTQAITEGAVGAADYSAYGAFDHAAVCDALLSFRHYAELDRCLRTLRARVAAGDEFTAFGVVSLSPDYVNVQIDTLDARRHLELGNPDEAARLADRAYQTAQTGEVSSFAGGYSAFYSILSFGAVDVKEENVRDSRIILSIPALGVAAIAHELAGDGAAGRTTIEKLEGLYENLVSGGVDTKVALQDPRPWIARYYYAQGDFETAYRWQTRDDRTATDKFGDGWMAVNEPVMDTFSYAIFGVGYSESQFYRQLPSKLMRARTAFELGKFQEARAGYAEILAAERIAGFGEIYFAALYDSGRIDIDEGKTDEAVEDFARAVDTLEAQRASINQDRYKLGFVEDKLAVYGDMVAALVALDRPDEAFEYAERAKARALVDLLADRSSFAVPDENSRVRLRDALERLKDLEQDSLQLARLDGTEAGAGSRAIEIQGLKQEVRSVSGEVISLVSVQKVSVTDIQATLTDQEVLIEYFQDGDRLTAFVVTGGSVQAVELDGRGLTEAVTAFRAALEDNVSTNWRELSRALYERLIPVEARVGAPILTVVPHGPLHYLPFAALYDGRTVLAERVAVRTLPSASVLRYLRARGVAGNRALLALGNPDVGDPALDLPGAEAETLAIAERWPSARRLLRANASETVFKQNGASFGYLHLASHGEFDASAPLTSGLLLAPDGENDGRLTVSEIYDLTLDAELITLSACETALGDIAGGDEVIGLTRGFLYAGARSVVASLWQVSDNATAELMERFYDNLKRMGRAEALRQAQLATKRDYGHPYYWAAFQLSGNG